SRRGAARSSNRKHNVWRAVGKGGAVDLARGQKIGPLRLASCLSRLCLRSKRGVLSAEEITARSSGAIGIGGGMLKGAEVHAYHGDLSRQGGSWQRSRLRVLPGLVVVMTVMFVSLVVSAVACEGTGGG